MSVKKKKSGYQQGQSKTRFLIYTILIILSVLWLFPIVWIILTSFRGEGGAFVPYIIPKEFTFENYRQLLANDSGSYPFVRWFLNTLFVAVFCPHLLQSQWPTPFPGCAFDFVNLS